VTDDMGEFFRDGDGHLGVFEMLVFRGISSIDSVETLYLYISQSLIVSVKGRIMIIYWVSARVNGRRARYCFPVHSGPVVQGAPKMMWLQARDNSQLDGLLLNSNRVR
jgi:hypothetical protein